jgi:acyl transferase domain-containing protein
MKTAVVICPGRGTYTKTELGYLKRHFPNAALMAEFDERRRQAGQDPLSTLDGAAAYSAAHSRGDNASGLIFAASYGDFLSLDGVEVEVVAVTGNSMGWYSALACGGALSPGAGFEVVNTMGRLMTDHGTGGQMIYPVSGPDWRPDPALREQVLETAGHAGLDLSIDLGGHLVLAGPDHALRDFALAVPMVDGTYPLRLQGHAAFHTGLVANVAAAGRAALPATLFGQPRLPMVDGRGHVWWPGATDTGALWNYTLGHQVVQPYDLAAAIRTAAREFAPDLFIVTGPGTTLGGSVAQSLIRANWRGMQSKSDFQSIQQTDPLLISMGMDSQRRLVTKGD